MTPVPRFAVGALLSIGIVPAQLPEVWLTPEQIAPDQSLMLVDDPVRGRLIKFGGNRLQRTTWEWDGQSWTLRQLARSPAGRDGGGVAWDVARRRLVLFGGWDGTQPRDDTWEYDGTTWSEAKPPASPPSRFRPMVAYDQARARVVLFGGLDRSSRRLGDTWEFDGATWYEVTPAVSPPPDADAGMTYDATRQQVVHFGSGRTWTWDGAAWTEVTPPGVSPPALAGQRLAHDPLRQRTVLFGGDTYLQSSDETWEWDGSVWTKVEPVVRPPANAYHGFAFSSRSGTVVLFGGWNGLAETWEWDGVNWRQRATRGGLPVFSDPALAWDSDRQRMVLYGDGGFFNHASTWEWDGNTWSRMAVGTGSYPPLPCAGHSMVYDSARQVTVLFGGYIGAPSLWTSETFEWDGATWTLRNPANRPAFGTNLAMAYDAARQRVVVFGGFGETWEYDGNDWVQRAPPTRPSQCARPHMAYDPGRQRSVLFDGCETWEWDGTDWTRSASVAPAVVEGMVYDSDRQRVVLLAGVNAGGRTWEWDGARWAAFGPPRPEGRIFSTRVGYDAVARALIVVERLSSVPGGRVVAQKRTLPASVTAYGASCAGVDEAPLLQAFGQPRTGNPGFALDVAAVSPGATVVFLLADRAANLPIGACVLRIDPERAVALPATANGGGFASLRLPVPGVPAAVGRGAFAQAAVLQVAAPLGFSLSVGLELRVGE